MKEERNKKGKKEEMKEWVASQLVAHACNPSTWEDPEFGPSGLQNETLSLKVGKRLHTVSKECLIFCNEQRIRNYASIHLEKLKSG